jgi:hypothetical protein
MLQNVKAAILLAAGAVLLSTLFAAAKLAGATELEG